MIKWWKRFTFIITYF